MEKRREIEIVTNGNVCLGLEYFLLIDEGYYGVAVYLCQDGVKAEHEHVSNVWEEKNQALKCIDILAENFVTPTTLIEILDELISQECI